MADKKGFAYYTKEEIDELISPEVVGSGDNICYKYPDGRMLALVRKTQSVTFASWNNSYESEVIFPPDYAEEFIATPICQTSIQSSSYQCWISFGGGRTNESGAAGSATRGQGVVLIRDASGTTSATIVWTAWGRWK